MNNDEMKMIDEMAETCNNHPDCLLCRYSPKPHSKSFWGEMWKSGCPNGDKKLVYAMAQGYRKVAEDEIVIKKSEYKELKKYKTDWLNSEKMHLQAELEDTEFELGCSNRLFQKVCEEKKELEKQLEQAKQETREVLQGICEFKTEDGYYYLIPESIVDCIASRHGIELED